jgi:hypothetical protein
MSQALDTIAFGEKLLQLLDQGAFTATYKYAVLLGLIDLCLENTSPRGDPATVLTTRQLAEKVVELYWPHTRPYPELPADRPVLRQNRGQPGSQAEILKAIQSLRGHLQGDDTAPLFRVRQALGSRFERLVRTVEWKLIEMPLPRLQRIGRQVESFVYAVGWDEQIPRSRVAAYQNGDGRAFDNRILLRPGVGEHLVRLNGLLRPLLYRQWTAEVASINGLAESRLESFLFGTERIAVPAGLRQGLLEMQDARCFYCGERISGQRGHQPEVDHFIPWARYPDNAIENLVVAHQHCNNDKRDFLAAVPHVTHWLDRLDATSGNELVRLSRQEKWESRPSEIRGAASAIYLRLPAGMELWASKGRFEPLDQPALRAAFVGSA